MDIDGYRYKRDVLFCYDLKLPQDFTPKNQGKPLVISEHQHPPHPPKAPQYKKIIEIYLPSIDYSFVRIFFSVIFFCFIAVPFLWFFMPFFEDSVSLFYNAKIDCPPDLIKLELVAHLMPVQ